ncbi:MAG: hypothetical protein KH330_10020 [Clostridiales bacterium]|nr:hypothetical protein [Clostridiales bacterium]
MEYVQMTLDDWVEMKRKLRQELQGVKQSFVRIGYALRKIDDQELYKQDGYKSIAEFAKEEYGLEPSTTSRFMSINREYSIDGYSEQLRPEFADLGRSQLEEMLKLPEGDRTMIQPETSREEIRELKRFNKAEPEAGVADDMRQLVEKFYHDNPEILNAVFKEPEFTEETIKRFIEIVNPGGNRSYKKGLYFLMMYENRVAVKKFGTDPQNLSWWEFWKITQDIFGETAAGSKTWQRYFGKDERKLESVSGTEQENGQENGKGHIEKQTDEMEEQITGQMEIQDYPEIAPEDKQPEEAPQSLKGGIEDKTGNCSHRTGFMCTLSEKEKQTPGTGENCHEKCCWECPKHGDCKMECTASSTRADVAPAQEQSFMNEPEIIEKPFGTRKDYMDSLTAYGMAEYIAAEYERHSLKAGYLSSKIMLEKWLLEKVDDKGYSMAEEKDNGEK